MCSMLYLLYLQEVYVSSLIWVSSGFFFSSRRRHTRCALVTGVQTCALPILRDLACRAVPPRFSCIDFTAIGKVVAGFASIHGFRNSSECPQDFDGRGNHYRLSQSTDGDGNVKYRLKMLGAFRITAPNGQRLVISSKKGIALLGLLATAKGGERWRTWLQEKLWGSRESPQAQASLRRELHGLRNMAANSGEIGRAHV